MQAIDQPQSVPFTELEQAQLAASQAQVEVLKAQRQTFQAQLQTVSVLLPRAEEAHQQLLSQITAAHEAAKEQQKLAA